MNFSTCQSASLFFQTLLFSLLVFAVFVQEGVSHIGQKCDSIFSFCRAKNSYCDDLNICRCLPEYPVNVTLHDCRKPRKYGTRCEYPEECSYHDNHSYCTQLPYRSICECLHDYIYSKEKEKCIKIQSTTGERQSLILPTILGISLAAACVMCCCLALWHFCQSRQPGEENRFLRRLSRNRQNNLNENRDVPSHYGDTLPPYEMIIRENELQAAVDELPPSYDDVVKQMELEIKQK